jgi:crotonobetainyl-CoA:carnitine CoA-transferase CaiB-like acyl-CoA transferase
MAQASVQACCKALDAAGVPAAKVQTIDEVVADPQTVARGMIVEQDHPLLGRIRLPNLPFRFSDCDTSPRGVAPLLGQHNREIAAELGYSAAQVDALVAAGVLYAEADVARLNPD